MRILKNIIIGLVVLTILVTLFSLLFPSSVKINRDIIINTSTNKVYQKIAGIRSWPEWYAAVNDTLVNRSMISFSTGKMEWVSEDGGKKYVEVSGKDSLFLEAGFFSSTDKKMQSRFILHPLNNGQSTRIEWQSLVELGWLPWNKFSGLLAENMIAPGVEISLKNLKTVLESEN